MVQSAFLDDGDEIDSFTIVEELLIERLEIVLRRNFEMKGTNGFEV